MMVLKTTLRIKDKHYGNTYDVVDTETGKEYVINQYPKNQRGVGSANYIVSKKYSNDNYAKTMTLRGAKLLILKKVV